MKKMNRSGISIVLLLLVIEFSKLAVSKDVQNSITIELPSPYRATIRIQDKNTNVTEIVFLVVDKNEHRVIANITPDFQQLFQKKDGNWSSFQSFPVTTETFKNKKYCLKDSVETPDIYKLVDNQKLQNCGKEEHKGRITTKWCSSSNETGNLVVFNRIRSSENVGNVTVNIPLTIERNSSLEDYSITVNSFDQSPFNFKITMGSMFKRSNEKKKNNNGLTCYFMHEIKREIDAEALPNQEEFRKHHPPRRFYLDTTHYKNLPEQFNWKDHGGLNEVKDQGSRLSSCWSFTAIAAIEFAYYKESGWKKLPKLSEQALIDCSWGFRNKGTFGGKAEWAFDWAIKHQNIPLEEDYPYVARNNYCTIENKKTLDVRVDNWGTVNCGSLDDRVTVIKAAIVNYGPLAIEMYSSLESFKSYKGGTYNDTKCESKSKLADHAALLVGYGKDEHGAEYWIIKNSYGKKWGIDGYAHIAIEGNICGVANNPLFVTISKLHQIL